MQSLSLLIFLQVVQIHITQSNVLFHRKLTIFAFPGLPGADGRESPNDFLLYFHLYFIYFSLIFMSSSETSTNFFFSPSFFRCKVRLFEIFLVSWSKHILLYISFLELLLLHSTDSKSLCLCLYFPPGFFFFLNFFFDVLSDPFVV